MKKGKRPLSSLSLLTSVHMEILISRVDLRLRLPFIPALAQLEERQTVIGYGII